MNALPAPPTNLVLLIGLITKVGSSCDIPKGSHVIYSSIIKSPITHTFNFEIFLIIFLILEIFIDLLFKKLLGVFKSKLC